MNYVEREQNASQSAIPTRCKIALQDWVNYWVTAGTGSIEDETIRVKTNDFLRQAIEDPQMYADRIAVILVGSPNIRDAEEITDALIKTEVDSILSNALDYIM